MSSLTRYSLRAALVSAALVLALGLGAGLVRLMPWLLSPEVPLGVARPFAQALMAVGFEAAFVVGVPAGCALGAALLVERGEARALHCMGTSPLSLAVTVLPLLTALGSVAFASTLAWQASTDHPGRFARELIEGGRGECDEDVGNLRSISVPVVGLTWLCFPGTPRITGPVPKSGGRAWFSAAELAVSEDLTAFRARDVAIGSAPSESKFRLGLRVAEANVTGLPAWGRSLPLSPMARAMLVAGALVCLGFGTVLLVTRLALSSRALAGGVGGLSGLMSLRGLHSFEAGEPPLQIAVRVLAVGLAVLAAPALLLTCWRLLPRKPRQN